MRWTVWGRVNDWFEPATGGPEIPLLEEACRRLGGELLMEFLERQPDLVGPRGLAMTRREAFERRPLAVRQIGRVAQPDLASAARQALLFLFGPASLVDGIVDDLDRIEFCRT